MIPRALATCLYMGYLPFAPGTWASAAAVLVYYATRNIPPVCYAWTVLIFFAAGVWSSGAAERFFGRKDPKEIVIDEFTGQLLVFLFIPFNLWCAVGGFIVFRILDIFKIPFLRKFESFPGGWGIMLDDIIAAGAINLVLQITKGA